jgi:hypothetical protein
MALPLGELARKRLRGLAVTERLKLRQQKAIMG